MDPWLGQAGKGKVSQHLLVKCGHKDDACRRQTQKFLVRRILPFPFIESLFPPFIHEFTLPLCCTLETHYASPTGIRTFPAHAIATAASMTLEEVPVTMSFLYSFFWLPGGIILGAILPSQEPHHKLIEQL